MNQSKPPAATPAPRTVTVTDPKLAAMLQNPSRMVWNLIADVVERACAPLASAEPELLARVQKFAAELRVEAAKRAPPPPTP